MKLTELKAAFFASPGPRQRVLLTRDAAVEVAAVDKTPAGNKNLVDVAGEVEGRFHASERPEQVPDENALAQADGVTFLCPRCLAAGLEHGISVAFSRVEAMVEGVIVVAEGRAAWERSMLRREASGTGLVDLTLAGVIPPRGACRNFGPLTVTDGEVL